MRDFSWNYFSMTGEVDAYLLYKEIDEGREGEDSEEENLSDEQTDTIT